MRYFHFKTLFINKSRHLLLVLFLYGMLSGCTNNNTELTQSIDPALLYNKNANEIIAKIIEDYECSCMFSIPKRSLIATAYTESISPNIENNIIGKLKLRNYAELNSLTNLSNNFKLDPLTLKKNRVKVISLEDFNYKNDSVSKICPNGILSIQKPIFDHNFKRAVIDYKWAYSCMSGPLYTFEFKDNTWVLIED